MSRRNYTRGERRLSAGVALEIGFGMAYDANTMASTHKWSFFRAGGFDQVILINQRLVAYGDTGTTFVSENIAKTYGAPHTIMLEAGRNR